MYDVDTASITNWRFFANSGVFDISLSSCIPRLFIGHAANTEIQKFDSFRDYLSVCRCLRMRSSIMYWIASRFLETESLAFFAWILRDCQVICCNWWATGYSLAKIKWQFYAVSGDLVLPSGEDERLVIYACRAFLWVLPKLRYVTVYTPSPWTLYCTI